MESDIWPYQTKSELIIVYSNHFLGFTFPFAGQARGWNIEKDVIFSNSFR